MDKSHEQFYKLSGSKLGNIIGAEKLAKHGVITPDWVAGDDRCLSPKSPIIILVNFRHKNFKPSEAHAQRILAGLGQLSDAAAETARFGYTVVDRPEGFLVLAIASLGDEVTELTSPPENFKPSEAHAQRILAGLGQLSDVAAETAQFGYTVVNRPEGFLVLAIASLGAEVTELTSPPEVHNFSFAMVIILH
ncbi:hypothetical protein Tco_1421366 [Tanacetum coccineum]